MIYVYWTMFAIIIAMFVTQIEKSFSAEVNTSEIRNLHSKNPISLIGVVVAFLPLFLLSALRYFVGTDYTTYFKNQIPWVLSRSNVTSVEPLYRVLIRVGHALGATQWIFFLTSLVTFIPIVIVVWNYSRSYAFSVFILMSSTFFAFSLNGMRQAISAVIIMYAATWISSSKKRFIFWSAIALLFHTTGIILICCVILAAVLKQHRISSIWYWGLAGVAYIVGPLMFKLISLVAIKLGYGFYFQVHAYIRFDKAIYASLALTLLLFGILSNNSKHRLSDLDHLFINLVGVSVVLLMLLRVAPAGARLAESFVPFQIIIIPNMIKCIKVRWKRMLFSLIIVFLFSYLFVHQVLVLNYNGTLPYQFIPSWNY